MLYFISISYSFCLWIFINNIPNVLTIQSTLKVAFQNEQAYIRCSDESIIYFYRNLIDESTFRKTLSCDDKYSYSNEFYAGLTWDKLDIRCVDSSKVNEQILISKHLPAGSSQSIVFANVGHKIEKFNKFYLFTIQNVGDSIQLELNNIPSNDVFADTGENNIYIRFIDQPMLCRIQFDKIKSCPSNGNLVDNTQFACYYDPNDKREPSIELMEAEMAQVNKMVDPHKFGAQPFSLKRPKVTNEHFGDASKNPKIDPNSDTDSKSNEKDPADTDQPQNNRPSSANIPDTSKKQSNIPRILIFIVVSLFIITIIGAFVAFFIKEKKQSTQPSTATSPPEQLEKGGSNTSSSTVAESLKSIEDNRKNDDDEGMKTKPNIATQKTAADKQHRPGTKLNFMEDG